MNAVEPRQVERIRSDFAAVTSSLANSVTLPPYCYKSDQILDWETSEIFLKEWMCVGRTDEIPNAGDYFTLEILGEPLVVTRDTDREISVFLDGLPPPRGACRRGARKQREVHVPFSRLGLLIEGQSPCCAAHE